MINLEDRNLRVIIAGGRDFTDYARLCYHMDHLTKECDHVEVVCGGAKGADSLGERWANEREFASVHKMNANWKDLTLKPCVVKQNKHGKYNALAGHNRNNEMAEYTSLSKLSALVAFWDGKSKGTQDMITRAKALNLNIRIINY